MQQSKGKSIPTCSYHGDYERKWVLQGGIKQVIISSNPFENLLRLYCTSVDLLHGLVGRLTLIFKADLPSPPPWLMDGPTIDGCISIKQSHPWWMNMSFINGASPHEVLSFFAQCIYPSARDWLTMEVIQSAIMTSSLINLPLTMGQPWLQFGRSTHTQPRMGKCVRHQEGLLLSLWDHGKVFHSGNSATQLTPAFQ